MNQSRAVNNFDPLADPPAPVAQLLHPFVRQAGLQERILHAPQTGDLDPQHLGRRFHQNYRREPWRGYASGPPTISNGTDFSSSPTSA